MPIYPKISIKNFNADKLLEEMAVLPIRSLGFAGFIAVNDQVFAPFPEDTRMVGYSSAGGNQTAKKGELRVVTSRNLTTAEDSALAAILAAHNATVLTAEQVRQMQDELDLDALLAGERDAFATAIQSMQTAINAWDAATTAEKLVIVKNFFIVTRANMITIGKVMRLFIRRERGAAI